MLHRDEPVALDDGGLEFLRLRANLRPLEAALGALSVVQVVEDVDHFRRVRRAQVRSGRLDRWLMRELIPVGLLADLRLFLGEETRVVRDAITLAGVGFIGDAKTRVLVFVEAGDDVDLVLFPVLDRDGTDPRR